MKKALALVLAFSCAFAFTPFAPVRAEGAAAETEAMTEAMETMEETEAMETEAMETETMETEAMEEMDDMDAVDDGVMSYAEYMAAEIDDEVVVDVYVQAKQSWWNDSVTVYAADQDGAYFIYNMACSEEDNELLVPGTKIRVTGYKAEWSGEIEIADATFEIIEGEEFIAEPYDVTDILDTEALVLLQNRYVSFTGMTVEEIGDGQAFLYNWDGSGEEGNDLYFNVSKGGQTYTFTVESYLCDAESDVYKAVKELQVGDVIDMEGFLYWYEGANPHITAVCAHEDKDPKSEGVMTYDEYMAAEVDDEVVIEAYVQAKQSWWNDSVTVYAADMDGAYFIYNMACSEEDNELLVPGTKIKVTGYKTEWSGEIEIADATFEIVEAEPYIAEPEDVTILLGTDAMAKKMNRLVCFSGMTVEEIGEDGAAFLYNWDGSGEEGNDLYFNVSKDGETYNFTVESYLCDAESDVYKAVKELQVGDVIDLQGFLYWYEGINPHITAVCPHMDEMAEEEMAEEKSEGVMTYDEYMAAAIDDEVVIEAYVQAKQSWWNDSVTVYAADHDGAYFIYNMACSEEENELLVPGAKIKVTGYKAEWSGEIEIADATFEVVTGAKPYIAEAVDVTELLGTDELVDYQNQFVCFKGMTVEEIGDGQAFLYNWDGSGEEGNDLYFNVSVNGETYNFTVESYLCDADSDVYKAVKELKVGDVIDLEGFLYWYEGANPHITSVMAAE